MPLLLGEHHAPPPSKPLFAWFVVQRWAGGASQPDRHRTHMFCMSHPPPRSPLPRVARVGVGVCHLAVGVAVRGVSVGT